MQMRCLEFVSLITDSTCLITCSSACEKLPINLRCPPSSVPLSKLDLNPGATATVTHLNPVIHDGRQEQLSVGILDSPADEMQNRRQKFGTQLHLDVLFRKCPTYLAKIAVVLQTAPGKMLTFTQVRNARCLCSQVKPCTLYLTTNYLMLPVLIFNLWCPTGDGQAGTCPEWRQEVSGEQHQGLFVHLLVFY